MALKNFFLKSLEIFFLLVAFFWLILAFKDIFNLGIYTKVKLTPLPIIIHAVSVIACCLIYLYILLFSTIKNIFLKFIVAIFFVLIFMATYESFYWFFLINNLDFYFTNLNNNFNSNNFNRGDFFLKKLEPYRINLKFLKLSILILILTTLILLILNRKFNFLSLTRRSINLSILMFLVFNLIMIILYYQEFFAKTFFWFTGLSYDNPHNWLWVLSKFMAMIMLLPLVKINNEYSFHNRAHSK